MSNIKNKNDYIFIILEIKMNFTEDWKPIEFLELKDDNPLPLAEVIPFIFKDKITKYKACQTQSNMVMIQYRLQLDFHKHICENVGIVYGMRKKETVTIYLLINKNNSYLKYIRIIEQPKTFLDLNVDILELISKQLQFKEQLNLRSSCQTINKNMVYHNYENCKFLNKVASLIKNCSLIVSDRCPEKFQVYKSSLFSSSEKTEHQFYTTSDIYSKVKLTIIINNREEKLSFLTNTSYIILGVSYTFTELINNIEIIKSLEFLVDLLDFDTRLRNTYKSFGCKDKGLMKQHKLASHYFKTNDCYFKFNKDLKQFFDDSEWFNVVKDIICTNKELTYSFKQLQSCITPIINFGKKVEENYDEIKHDLSIRKRHYHNGKKSRTYNEYGSSDSDSSDDY